MLWGKNIVTFSLQTAYEAIGEMIYYLTMKNLLLIVFLGLVFFSFKPVRVWGSEMCQYGSTQARVQKNINDPWVQEKTINLGEGFNVGSFHDHTGQFANDTVLRVDGPDGFFSNYHNGDMVRPTRSGSYELSVTTVGKEGGACEEKAKVNVVKSKSEKYHGRKWTNENHNHHKETNNDNNSVYRRDGWWNSDGRARYGEGIYTRDGWYNSDGQARYGEGIYTRNGWWGM
jgi:hypothetical protein